MVCQMTLKNSNGMKAIDPKHFSELLCMWGKEVSPSGPPHARIIEKYSHFRKTYKDLLTDSNQTYARTKKKLTRKSYKWRQGAAYLHKCSCRVPVKFMDMGPEQPSC